MTWNKQRILQELRRLHRGGADLSYNALANKRQALVSALKSTTRVSFA